jgi:uroporphyrinogen-III synthase
MSKTPTSKPTQPLSGIRVLVGRARHQAGLLSSELRKLGATTIEIPFIEIRKPRSFRPLDSALKNLEMYDWLILTSVNGVEAMWERMGKSDLQITASRRQTAEKHHNREGHEFTRAAKQTRTISALAAEGRLHVAAIGPATKKAIEERGARVDVMPKEYVAESVVRSLKRKVKGKRVLLVRAKVARDVIPRELRRAGAHVDVVEAYETVVPQNSRRRLQTLLKSPKRRPHVVTFTSSSTVRNFVELLSEHYAVAAQTPVRGRGRPRHAALADIRMASIGPVTSSTLRELGLKVDIQAQEFTIPGLVQAIVRKVAAYEWIS